MLTVSQATTRALLLGVAATLIGVLGHSLEALILGLPFVLYTGWAAATRPRRMPYAPRRAGQVSLVEGVGAELLPELDPSLPLVTVDWPDAGIGWTTPRRGVTTTLGEPAPYVLTPTRWGSFQVGGASVVQSDSLGAWHFRATTRPLTARVEPETTALFGPAGVRNPNGVAGIHSARQPGEGSALAEVREFRSGDQLRRINWAVTARAGSLHVTQTHTERDTDVFIVLDSQCDLASTTAGGPTSLDLAVRAGMALARHFLSLGDRVGMHDLWLAISPVPTGTGRGHLRRLLAAVTSIQRETRRHATLLPLRAARPGSLVFLCTPMLNEAVAKEADRLRRSGMQVVVIDCFPVIGDGSGVAPRDRAALPVALRLQESARFGHLHHLQQQGCPVVRWEGPTSLAGILLALQHNPTMARRRMS